MIETNLQHQDLILNEPQLENQLHQGQVDYQQAIDTAYRLMVQDVKNQNLDVRKLCKKLWLQETSATATSAAYNSATSLEDRVERMRWVINISALSTGQAIFSLQGKNKTSESWTTMTTVQCIEKGINKFLTIEVAPNRDLEIYKYYRISKVDTTSTVTFTSYLVELTYENLHLWRTLALVFEELVVKGSDIFRDKADKYEAMYEKYLLNNRYYYDSDDDGIIGDPESEADYRQLILSRG